jgi:E3 ubiquitin-protein ligase HERC2
MINERETKLIQQLLVLRFDFSVQSNVYESMRVEHEFFHEQNESNVRNFFVHESIEPLAQMSKRCDPFDFGTLVEGYKCSTDFVVSNEPQSVDKQFCHSESRCSVQAFCSALVSRDFSRIASLLDGDCCKQPTQFTTERFHQPSSYQNYACLEGKVTFRIPVKERRLNVIRWKNKIAVVSNSRVILPDSPPVENFPFDGDVLALDGGERFASFKSVSRHSGSITFRNVHEHQSTTIWTVRVPPNTVLRGCSLDDFNLLILVESPTGASVCSIARHTIQGELIDPSWTSFRPLTVTTSGQPFSLQFAMSGISIGRFPLKLHGLSFTVECWVFFSSLDDNQVIFSHGDKSMEEVVVEGFPSQNGFVIRGGSRSRAGASYSAIEVPGISLLAKWFHVALVFSGTQWRILLNGKQCSVAPACSGCPGVEDSSCVLGKTFVGHLAECRIWSRSRTETEIRRDLHRSIKGCEPGIIGYFPLYESGGVVVADLSASRAHAILPATATFSQIETPIGRCESFVCDATAHMMIRNSRVMCVNSGRSFTICCPTSDGRCVVLEYDLEACTQTQCITFDRGFDSILGSDDTLSLFWLDIKTQRLSEFQISSCVSGWQLKGDWGSLWEAGRSLLKRLADHPNSLRMQCNQGDVIPRLLSIAGKALTLGDEETMSSCQNILAHCIPWSFVQCDTFSDCNQFVLNPTERGTLRDMLHWLAFCTPKSNNKLMVASLPLLLESRAMFQAVTKFSGSARSSVEEKLFCSCAEYLTSVESLQAMASRAERTSQFITALIEEACFAFRNSCSTSRSSPSNVSECLFRAHEALLRCGDNNVPTGTLLGYFLPVLKGIEKCVLFASSCARKEGSPTSFSSILEDSFVGKLLPAVMSDIAHVPLSLSATLIPAMSLVRDAIASAVNVLGCTSWLLSVRARLVESSTRLAADLVLAGSDGARLALPSGMFNNLFRNGQRKSGTPRDAFIRNLLQGVGVVSRLLTEIQTEDMPLRMKDGSLLVLERQLTACYSNVLLDDSVILHPTRDALLGVYRHVKSLRTWVLSKRQDSQSFFELIEAKSLFLCKFEPCAVVRSVPISVEQQHTTNAAKKWRRMFQAWKSMRSVKVLMSMLSNGQSNSPKDVAAFVTAFIQSEDLECEEIERALQLRSLRAQQRQAAFVAFRSLLEEGRIDAGVDSITSPFIGKALCGRHYLDGIEGCTSEVMLRLRASFFQMLEEIVSRLDRSDRPNVLCKTLLAALAAPWLAGDFNRIGIATVRHAVGLAAEGSLCSLYGMSPTLHNVLTQHMVSPRPENCSGGVCCGSETLTLRGNGARGMFLGSIAWKRCPRGNTQYFEVTIIDLGPSATVGVGLGPATFNVARPPGWDVNSYALNSEDGVLFVESSTGRETGYNFGVGDVVGCGWSANGEIFWTRNGKLLNVTVESACASLCPLIGFDGKGTVAVNFGQECFEYTVDRSYTASRPISSQAFDVVRALCLRIVEVMNSNADTSSHELDGCRKMVDYIFTVFAEVFDMPLALPQFHSAWCKLALRMLQLMRSHSSHYSSVNTAILCTSLANLAKRTANQQLCCDALHVLGNALYFAPVAPNFQDSEGGPLKVLHDLALGERCASVPGIDREWTDTCAWTAIAVLREINLCPQHPWGTVVHDEMVMPALRSLHEPRRRLRVLLHLLSGSAESIPLVGEKVLIKELRESREATLVQSSLSDEVCRVVFSGSGQLQFVSMRLVSKSSCSQKTLDRNCPRHREQANSVEELAYRMFGTSPMDTESHSLLQLQLQTVRVIRQLCGLGMIRSSTPLMKLAVDWCSSLQSSAVKDSPLSTEDLVLTALEMRRVDGLEDDLPQSPNAQNTPTHAQSNAPTTTDSIDDTRTRMAQELSMRGFSLEMCMIALEETHYDRTAALRLLTDHHEDLLHVLQQEHDAEAQSEGDDEAPSEEDDDASGGHLEEEDSTSSEDSSRSVDSHMSQRLSDGLRFDGESYVKIVADSSAGPQFTLDFWIRPRNSLDTPELVFFQQGSSDGISMFIVVDRCSVMFGWGDVDDALRASEEQTTPARGICCMELLGDHDSNRWTRITCVQDCADITMFKNGSIRDSTVTSCADGLLSNDLYIGGCPVEWCQAGFTGDIKDVRVFETALSPDVVETMFSLAQSPNPSATSPFLVIHLRFDEGSFPVENSTSSPNGIPVTVTTSGSIEWLQSDSDHVDTSVAAVEVDFCAQSDFEDFTVLDLQQDANSLVAIWKKFRTLPLDELKHAHIPVMRELVGRLACDMVLMHAEQCCTSNETLEWVPDAAMRSITSFVLRSNDKELNDLLAKTLVRITHDHEKCGGLRLLQVAYSQLAQLASIPQKTSSHESPHPCKGYTEAPKEVSGGCQSTLFFDQRCSAHAMLLTIYTDRTFGSVAAQYAATTLTAFRIRAPQFFFDVRIDSAVGAQWGYKMYIVSDDRCQISASRLMRKLLSCSLERRTAHSSVIIGNASDRVLMESCVSGMLGNAGKTRRLLMSIVTDSLRFSNGKVNGDIIELLRLQDIRKMAEKQFRRETAQLHHCRFIQVSTEYFLAIRDAEHVARESVNEILVKSDEGVEDPVTQFASKRREQKKHYSSALRDGRDRVAVEKLRFPDCIRIEPNVDRTIAVWGERAGCSVMADVALSCGQWYFEVKMVATADVTVGVLSSNAGQRSALADDETVSWGYNGRRDILPTERPWKTRDVIGVVIDTEAKNVLLYCNGGTTPVVVPYGRNAMSSGGGAADAASSAHQTTENGEELDDNMSAYPYFVLGADEGILLNFGATHFEYDVPGTALPLDPTHLSLGTLIPFNQVRSLEDVVSNIVVAPSHASRQATPTTSSSSFSALLPPYFVDDADPFDCPAHRQGPPHVSLTTSSPSTSQMLINILEAKNNGTQFATVKSDCTVFGGRWYFEVVLGSQGLMQVGWISGGDAPDVSVGDSPNSWAVDGFRRVKWHNSAPIPIGMTRRWIAGDVVGCSIDIDGRHVVFSLNGRQIAESYVPATSAKEAGFCAAVTMRSGNSVTFNFGSTPLRFKPDGFSPLGVPDTWHERIDTYYSTLTSDAIVRRRATVSDAIRIMRGAVRGTNPFPPVLFHLKGIVRSIDEYCATSGRSYLQLSGDVVAGLLQLAEQSDILKALGCSRIEECFQFLKNFARIATSSIPMLPLSSQDEPTTENAFVAAARELLFRSVREQLVTSTLRETNCKCEHLRLTINRMRSRNLQSTGNEGTPSIADTVFGQTHELLRDQGPRMFRTSKRMWSVVFMGEGAEDVGGPYREHLGDMCRELMSNALPLFVPTSNHVNNTGTHRDALVPNPSATSELHMSMFTFLGRLMGGAMRGGEPLNLILPPLFWKLLSTQRAQEPDLSSVDKLCLQCAHELTATKAQFGAEGQELFDETFETERFATTLSGGSTCELLEGGSSIPLTFDRCDEYVNLLVNARLFENRGQISAIRKGLLSVVPELVVSMLTPDELELRICGASDYTVTALKGSTTYEGVTSEDRRVGFLWQALEDATPVQRRLFLKFVSGRERMPVQLRVLPMATQGETTAVLPRAATCFFAIEVPDYPSLDVFKNRLYYAIENCQDIDTDFRARDVDDDDGPELMMGVDGRHDDTQSDTNTPAGE